jgi:hypothetical protein
VVARVQTLLLPLLVILLVGLAGCTSDECRRACRHMLDDCGIEKAGYNVEDCTVQCDRYIEHYSDDWQVKEARRSVTCVADAPCEELRAGTPCYDEAVYVW